MEQTSLNDLCTIAAHPNTPSQTLKELSVHPSYQVRSNVAGNPSTPLQSLMMLMEDRIASTKLSAKRTMASRPDAPLWVLDSLTVDDNSVVADRASSNPALDADRLDVLAHSDRHFTRFGASKNPSTSFSTLLFLLHDEAYEISITAYRRLESLESEQFNSCLLEAGLTDLVGLPRDWVLKSLG